MVINAGFDNGQTQAGAFDVADVAAPAKGGLHSGLIGGGDADALVAHLQDGSLLVLAESDLNGGYSAGSISQRWQSGW
jgi:hypothetical protein